MAGPAPRPSLPGRAQQDARRWSGPQLGALFALCAATIAGVMWVKRPVAPSEQAAASASAAEPPAPPRCAEVGEELVVGDKETAKLIAPDPGDAGAEDDDPLAPFAAEIGRGVAVGGGFAVGVRHDTSDGAVALVARVGKDGKGGALVKLGRTRGDLDPPTVAANGDGVLVALLEPAPRGRTVRVAAVRGSEVAWGMTANEGDDESLALDVAVSEGRGAVAWDDVPREGRSRVSLAILDADKLGQLGAVVRFAEGDRDLDSPKLAARPGGFWLAWIAHAEGAAEPDDDAKGPKSEAKKPSNANKPDRAKADKKRPASTEVDEELGGERIAAQWIEIVPLDLTGVPLGAPRAVTPKGGRVLAFDLAPLADGNALIAFTDGDTPSGSSGGRLALAVARPSGTVESRVVSEEELGTGVPTLAAGLLVVPSLAGAPFVVDLDALGAPRGPILREASLLRREVLAASGALVFVARLAGKQARLGVLRCGPAPPPPPPKDPSTEPAPPATRED